MINLRRFFNYEDNRNNEDQFISCELGVIECVGMIHRDDV